MPQPVKKPEAGHIPHSRPGENGMSILDISSWDYDDGSVGAVFDALPQGVLWASDDEWLMLGIHWLFSQLEGAERSRMMTNGTQVALDLGMKGKMVEGKFLVRFTPMPDFGLEFDSQEQMANWLTEIIQMGVAIAATSSGKLQA
jgi:hypothetical protein